MTKESFLFIGIVALTVVITLVGNQYFAYLKNKSKMAWFKKNDLLKYESIIDNYFMLYGIERGASINTILDKIGYTVALEAFDNGKEADIKEHVIRIDKNLSREGANFGIAHEIAHLVFNDSIDDSIARKPHAFKIRSQEEQIRDYVAAAMLLPKEDIEVALSNCSFSAMKTKDKMNFISDYARQKSVSSLLVLKRIEEVALLR